jgi:hypothetical protein
MPAGRIVDPGTPLFQFEIAVGPLGSAVDPLVVWVAPEPNVSHECTTCKTVFRIDGLSLVEASEFYKGKIRPGGAYVCAHYGRLIE